MHHKRAQKLEKSMVLECFVWVQVPSSAVFSKALIIQETLKKPVKSRLFYSKITLKYSYKIRINMTHLEQI